MHQNLATSLKLSLAWLLFTAILTLIFGIIYAAAQQNYRQSANDPQIELTEEVASTVKQGAPLNQLLPPPNTDIGASLSPFILIYGDDGKPIAGTGQLDKQFPTPPSGVFDFVRQHGQERLTWQPNSKIRIAAVVKRLTGDNGQNGFVIAGRSLREVEVRVQRLTIMVGLGWIVAIIISLIMLVVVHGRHPKADDAEEHPHHHESHETAPDHHL